MACRSWCATSLPRRAARRSWREGIDVALVAKRRCRPSLAPPCGERVGVRGSVRAPNLRRVPLTSSASRDALRPLPAGGARRAGLVGTTSLLPPELRGLRNPIEAFEREDRVGELLGTAVQHGTRQRQELLLHRLCVGEGVRLAGRVDVEPLVYAIARGDGDARAEGVRAADFEPVVLHNVEFIGERIDRGIPKPL